MLACRYPLRLLSPAVYTTGDTESFAEATRAGLITGRPPEVSPSHRLPVANVEPVELASAAGTLALTATQLAPDRIDDLYYAWTYFQGGHFWSPTHEVARRLKLRHAFPIGVQQMCNGAAAALQLAARVSGKTPFTALIATADVFAAPGFDRWAGDYGVLYGDAGAAVVATNDPTVHRQDRVSSEVLAVHTVALPHLARMHREPIEAPADPRTGWPVSAQRTKKRFLQEHTSATLTEQIQTGLREAIPRVLADVGEPISGRVYLPRLMDSALESLYLPVVTEFVDAPTVRLGERTGHLGAGDLIANLAHAHAHAHQARQVDLLISAGAGFTITVAVTATSAGGE